jgi:DNA-binding LacI/PurR family transcriptional regulator
MTGNNRQGRVQAAEHLHERGHRHVSVLAGYSFARSSLDRTQVFVECFAKRGVHVPDSAVIYGNIDPSRSPSWRRVAEAPSRNYCCFGDHGFFAIPKGP